MIEPIPFGDRILLKLDPKESVIGPLELPESASQRSWPATVVAVGEDCRYFQVGDKCLISFYTGIVIQIYENRWLDNTVRMVREDEILAKYTRRE